MWPYDSTGGCAQRRGCGWLAKAQATARDVPTAPHFFVVRTNESTTTCVHVLFSTMFGSLHYGQPTVHDEERKEEKDREVKIEPCKSVTVVFFFFELISYVRISLSVVFCGPYFWNKLQSKIEIIFCQMVPWQRLGTVLCLLGRCAPHVRPNRTVIMTSNLTRIHSKKRHNTKEGGVVA